MASDPPSPGSHQRISPVRAAVVMAGFLVAVAVLVAVGTRPSVSGDALAPITTTTTTVPGNAASTTTTTTVPRNTITVLVANGTNGAGVAAHFTTVLGSGGWSMKTATDATSHSLATSTVYYASNEQQAAAAIATSLGLKPAAVLPLTTAAPVAGTTGVDVVVVIGADLVAVAGT
jgi:hypothetical protein